MITRYRIMPWKGDRQPAAVHGRDFSQIESTDGEWCKAVDVAVLESESENLYTQLQVLQQQLDSVLQNEYRR